MPNLTLGIAMAALASSIAPAASAEQGPLEPGKPAGVQQAQLSNPNAMLFVGLGVLVIGAGIYMASGHYQAPGTRSATSTR